MTDQRTPALAMAGRLINLVRAGEMDTATGSLSMLSYAGPAHRERLRQVLAILIEAIAAMVTGKAGSMETSGLFAVDLRREDESAVDIDSLDPPVRAVIRAILAQVNDHPEDAAYQIGFAVAGGRQATVEAVVLALRWTVNAVENCEDIGLPTPEWLMAG
jgi:hypothetical protein